MELNQHSNISCLPPNPISTFQEQLIFVFRQLNSQPSSFLSSLDDIQVTAFTVASRCAFCSCYPDRFFPDAISFQNMPKKSGFGGAGGHERRGNVSDS
jgi:hypothetical protein